MEIDGQIRVLMSWIYRAANKKVDVGGFFKQHAADQGSAVALEAPGVVEFVCSKNLPESVKKLAELLKENVIKNVYNPFTGP